LSSIPSTIPKLTYWQYEEELEEARKKGKVVVFFWRKGCWPCKKLTPMVGKLSEDFPDYSFLKVDADVRNCLLSS